MNVLRLGSKGEQVEDWQLFLIGLNEIHLEVSDGDFGPKTEAATKEFQRMSGLYPDGVVGNQTYSAAMKLGYEVVKDDSSEKTSPNWPPAPNFKPIYEQEERERLFGKFNYVHAPTATNSERIEVTDDWKDKNLAVIRIPQLVKIKGSPNIYFHNKVANQMIELWAAWEREGLLDRVLTWEGTYSARFIRGSRKILSNHAFATAFDINAAWNRLGVQPALIGQRGSVRELVPLANKYGFYWGGHYSKRADGMHFEIAKVL